MAVLWYEGGYEALMTDQQVQSGSVGHFRNSLAKIVDLGYGDDECEFVVTVMFEELVRQVVPDRERKKLSFRLPAHEFANQNTYKQLHTRVAEVARIVDRRGAARDGKPRRSAVLFPFMTTLGVSGGVFLLACYITRLVPTIF